MAVYNAKDCVVTVGNMQLKGYGSKIATGGRDNPKHSVTVGVQGDYCVNSNNNNLGTITVPLLATSPSNPYLISLANSQEEVPIQVVNRTLGIRFGGSKAIVKNVPAADLGETAAENTYEFQVFDYELTSI